MQPEATGSCHPEPTRYYVTELGCLVQVYEQINARAELSEHVTLSGPELEKVEAIGGQG